MLLRKALLIAAVVFPVVALGALMLIAVDLSIGRRLAGDLFIARLNGTAAVIFWVWWSRGSSRRAG